MRIVNVFGVRVRVRVRIRPVALEPSLPEATNLGLRSGSGSRLQSELTLGL